MTVKIEDFVREEHLRARRNIHDVGRRIKYQIDKVLASVERGDCLNNMGELQGLSSDFEARVGAYTATREAFALIDEE